MVCPLTGETTYGQLGEQAYFARCRLAEVGVSAGDRVVLLMKRSAAVIAALLGTLRAGATYVPVAHGMPEDRILHIARDSGATAIICDAASVTTAQSVADAIGAAVVDLDAADPESVSGSSIDERPGEGHSAGTTPCYLLYTSGSTGVPKGVIVSHDNVSDYARWAIDYFGIDDKDVILSTAPFYFDMSTFDIYASLMSGATLVIASEKDVLFPRLLLGRIRDNRVTIWKAVSSLFGHVSSVARLDAEALSSLRSLVFSGERLPTHFLGKWMDALPEVSYFNAYGPTEATGISSCHRFEARPNEKDEIPIGLPCERTEILLFDGEKRILCANSQGEIVISGPGIAHGYWNDADKTAAAFVTSIGETQFASPAYRTGDLGYFDADGVLWFVGRVDRQIKHQGYRIELDDIELALQSIDGVNDAAVIHRSNGKSPELAAFFEAAGEVDEAGVREQLKARLPAYMVPRIFRKLDALPRTDRGKIDYFALEHA